MAWVRTSTSLISFGFTIYKFFQYLKEQNTVRNDRLFGPREYALLMISVGVVALVFATVQHRRDMKALRVLHPEIPYSLVTVLAGFMSLIGVVTLLAVIFRSLGLAPQALCCRSLRELCFAGCTTEHLGDYQIYAIF